MKILHVISSMHPRMGGPCQGVRNLVPCFLDAGNSVEVVCLDDPASDYLKTESVTVHALGRGRWYWSYHPALRPWLTANVARFDAIILNGLWQYPGHALSRLARKLGDRMPPYFVYAHGMLDPWFQRAPERRLKAIRNWFYWKLIEQHVIHRARAVLFTCGEELRLAQKTFRPYRPRQELNVGYGVSRSPVFCEDMAGAFAAKCPELNGRPYLLFLGRIHPKKGVDLLIRAYAGVYRQKGEVGSVLAPNSQLLSPALVIAGPGLETHYGTEMQWLAAQLCPASSVYFPGMLAGDTKWGAIYGCEAFALTSHQENFGIAVAEAMACGKPVLISNQINIWKEIDTDRAGFVAQDTKEGATQLLQCWLETNSSTRGAMSRQAKRCFENRFSIATSANKLIETISTSRNAKSSV